MFVPIFDENPKRHIKYAVVTYGLIALNILVFLVTVTLPKEAFETATIEYGMIPIVVRGLVASPTLRIFCSPLILLAIQACMRPGLAGSCLHAVRSN
ncbi:MAG: hypothetical protein HY371_16800, partial [Devosia nanyangense]|nr:hypothetical protein [Devosia nanyangense]